MNCSLNFDASLLHKKRALDTSISYLFFGYSSPMLVICYAAFVCWPLNAWIMSCLEAWNGMFLAQLLVFWVKCRKNTVRCLSLLFYRARMMTGPEWWAASSLPTAKRTRVSRPLIRHPAEQTAMMTPFGPLSPGIRFRCTLHQGLCFDLFCYQFSQLQTIIRNYQLGISLGFTIIGTAIRCTAPSSSQAGPICSVIEMYIAGKTVLEKSVSPES